MIFSKQSRKLITNLAALCLAIIFSQFSLAETAKQKQPLIDFVDGWIEATAIVRDIDRAQRFFIDIAGYQVIHSGKTPIQILNSWQLPQEAAGKEVLLAEPDTQRGFVRLIELAGVEEQIEARSAGQFFDTGGIMGLNTRVFDIDQTFRNLQRAGWRPLADPVRFSVEEFSVAEAIFQGPDGLVIGLIERERPKLGPDWTMQPGRLSRPNNAFVSSRNMQRDLDFYKQTLGWSVFLKDQGKAAASAGMNLYGWPHDIVESISRDVAWIHPASGGEGSIALMSLGVEGRDFSKAAKAPNYGWISLRTWTEQASTQSSELSSEPFMLEPYQCVVLSVLRDPGGVQIEHLSPSTACKD